jgi:hypothetical protein
MSGNLTIMGEVTVGAALPVIGLPIAAVIAELQAKLAGALALQIHLGLHPPSLAANLDACAKLIAALNAMIALHMPYLDIQIAAVAALILQLQGKLAVLLGLGQLLATAGVLAAVYEGDTRTFGPTVTSALGSGILGGTGIDEMYAVVLSARASVSITALKGVFIHV